MHPATIIGGLVLVHPDAHLSLGNLGIDQRLLLLSRLLVRLGLPDLRAAPIRRRGLGALGIVGLGQLDAVRGFVGRDGCLVVLPGLDVGLAASGTGRSGFVVIHIFRKRYCLGQNGWIGEARNARSVTGVVHRPDVGKGILDTAEGGGIAPLVGMDLADEVKVGPLEELELAVNVGARRQLGAGQGRELLACPRRSGRDDASSSS